LRAYVDAFLATSEQSYLKNAFALANFLEKTMVSKDGALKRVLSEGRVSVDGFLDDYAWTSYAFMKLYQASFDKHWLDLSKLIADHAIGKFWEKGSKLFYYSAFQESSLVVNKFETADEGIPSSNAIMANVLYSLGIMYDRSEYVDMSLEMLHTVSGNMKTFPVYHAAWCGLAGLFAYGSYEVAVMGKDAIARNLALQKKYLPDCIVMGGIDKEDLPLLENKLKENKTLLYVCTNKICKRPVEQVEEALGQIREGNFRK
jgi:uncharacterized protein YyaL (SSP411 family)